MASDAQFSFFFYHVSWVAFYPMWLQKILPMYELLAAVLFKETGCYLGCDYFMQWDQEWGKENITEL